MAYKSRENFNINKCLKIDCINRDIKCKKCIKYDWYKKVGWIICPYESIYLKNDKNCSVCSKGCKIKDKGAK
jgi:hypothetical protein